MIKFMQLSLENWYGIKLRNNASGYWVVPIADNITFENVRDYLMALLVQVGCDYSAEVNTDDGLGTEEFSHIRINKGGSAYLLKIISNGNDISVKLSH